MWTCAKTETKNQETRFRTKYRKKNYDDILLVTVNIKVASKCEPWKKEKKTQSETKTKTTNYTKVALALSILFAQWFGRGSSFFSALFFQTDFISLDQVSVCMCICRREKPAIIRFSIRQIHLADINKMSAPEHGNNGEFEHWLYVRWCFRWLDCYLLIPLDSYSPPLSLSLFVSLSTSFTLLFSLYYSRCVCVFVLYLVLNTQTFSLFRRPKIHLHFSFYNESTT